ncbi:unnamed protein product [Sphagnum compactum]
MGLRVKGASILGLLLMALLLARSTEAREYCGSISQFLPCMPAVRPDNRMMTPSVQCCGLVRRVSSACLCAALTSSIPGFPVDFNLGLTLPRKCGRYVPRGQKCAGVLVPRGNLH